MDKLYDGKHGLQLRKPLDTRSQTFPMKLFIEIAFVGYFSRLLSNIQSEQSYDYTSHVESQTGDLNCKSA